MDKEAVYFENNDECLEPGVLDEEDGGQQEAEDEADEEEGGDEDRGPGRPVHTDPVVMVVMVVFQGDQGITFAKLMVSSL